MRGGRGKEVGEEREQWAEAEEECKKGVTLGAAVEENPRLRSSPVCAFTMVKEEKEKCK